MNLIVSMPPSAEREKMLDAWIKVFEDPDEYGHFQNLVGKLIKSGYSHHGITCYLIHEETGKEIRDRLAKRLENPDLEIAFSNAICLN